MSDDPVQKVTELLKEQGIEDAISEETPKEQKKEAREAEQIAEEPQAQELSEFEQEQQAKGWNPNGPKSAEEWARAEPLYEEIKARGKENKQMRRTINELKEHMQKLEEHAYQKAVRELEKEYKTAVYNGDEEEAQRLQQEKEQMVKPEPVHDAVLDFQDQHAEWLNGKSFEALEMKNWVMQRDNDLMSYGLPPEEHMALLDEHVRKKFPNYFEPVQEEVSQVTAAVDSGHSNNVAAPASKSKKKFALADLNAEQKQTARDFEKMGVMSVDEYIKQLVSNGDLK